MVSAARQRAKPRTNLDLFGDSRMTRYTVTVSLKDGSRTLVKRIVERPTRATAAIRAVCQHIVDAGVTNAKGEAVTRQQLYVTGLAAEPVGSIKPTVEDAE